MKKLTLSLFALLIISGGAMAEGSKIIGKWLLTKAEMNGKTEEVYQIVNFKTDGYAEMEGRVFGTWKTGKKGKAITIESQMIKEFDGKWKIAKRTKKKMVLKKEANTLFLSVYNPQKIKENNKKSGFAGVWKLKDKNEDGADIYLNFKLPDVLKLQSLAPGVSGKSSGMWIFKKKSKALILMIHDPLLRGISKIKKISKNKFVLEKKGKKIQAKRIKQNVKNREQLTLNSDENTEEDAEEPKSLNPEVFPWFNIEAKIAYLKNVRELKYKKSKLLEGFDAFISEEITAKVAIDEDAYQITIDPLFEGLSAREYDEQNVFYPVKEQQYYNVTGEKEITVPAGTFMCTVVEAEDDFGDGKIRYYMINNQPGVYAKIIIVKKKFEQEEYTMYELSGIESRLKK